MQITIDTNNLSDIDRVILSVITGNAGVVVNSGTPTPAPAAEEKPKAKKAAKVKIAAVPDPEPVEEAAPEPEEEPEVAAGPTVADAVKVAMGLVSSGRPSVVKEALSNLTASKVSELEGDEVQKFLDAVAALDSV